ncbi:g7420 [Coccomyxa viridis]|uniref:G7420 protein n=1 Tax=Coccomyxa viridis TaxID=1274662 RepID=A0ABP1FXT4_9CHLO
MACLPPISEEKKAELDQMSIEQLQASIRETTTVKARGSSIYRGVSHHSGKWQARIYYSGKKAHLGLYQTEEEAAHAYDRAAIAKDGRKALVNFEDSFTEVPRLGQPMPGSHSASQHVLTRSGSMPSASLSQPNLTASSSHHTDKKDCPSHNSRPKMEGEQAVHASNTKADSATNDRPSPKQTHGLLGQKMGSQQQAEACASIETLPGYNVPDWANWEGDPSAYEADPYTADPGQAPSKPWFPYNPADANSEDEFSDHEAEVNISDIHIPGWTTEQLREYIESGQLQPSLRLLGTNPQPKPVTTMTGAAEASWKAFQNACKHPDSMEAWNECETAGNNYLNTYATLSSDDEDMAEDPSSTEGTSAKLSPGDLSTALNLVQHPLVHAEQLLLKGEIDAFLETLHSPEPGKNDEVAKVLELQESIHKAEVEFDEAKGEIPMEFLHVEYKLFREDLRALMGKPPDNLPAKAADDERYYAPEPGQHPCVHRVKLTEEEAAQMDLEMEQYDAELAEHGGWPAARDDTIYL